MTRARAFDELYLSTYRVNLTQYEGQYEFWHNAMVMTVKICANNILYWGTECLLFFHDKYADVDFMASVRPDLERIWAITRRLEAMYREWNVLEYREWRRAIVPTQAFPGMFQRHVDMAGGFDDDGVRARLAATADMMEAFAVLAFSRAAQNLGDAAPAEDVKINPYAVSLDPERWEADGLFDGSGMSLAEARETDAAGLANLFLEAVAQPVYSGARVSRGWCDAGVAWARGSHGPGSRGRGRVGPGRGAYATSGRVSALTNSSSWSVRQHSNAMQCFSYAAITLSP